MNQQETEQLAACRMHVAHLHNALKAAHAVLNPDTAEAVQAAAALELSEPELRAMVLSIGEDGSVLSRLQSEALNAAVSGVRAHHEDVRKARAEGDTALAHANEQLQSQGQALVACRAELQSKADALAQVTARLSKVEARARGAVAAAQVPAPETDGEGVDRVEALQAALKDLDEALK